MVVPDHAPYRYEDAGSNESGDQISEPAAENHAEEGEDRIRDHGSEIPRMMFMSTPMLDFMNCSASHPAIPPIMIAAIQPMPACSIPSSAGLMMK